MRRRKRRGFEDFPYSSVSPFVDKKIFEYTHNIINSSYLTSTTADVFELLCKLLSPETIGRTFKEYMQKHNLMAALKNTDRSIFDFHDLDDLSKVLSKPKIIEVILTKVQPIIKKERNRLDKLTPTDKKLVKLGQIFKLNTIELNIVALIYCLNSSRILSSQFCSIVDLEETIIFINHSHEVIGCSKIDILRSFRKGNLKKCELLGSDISLEDWLIEYLSGFNNNPLADRFCRKSKGNTINIDEHLIDKNEKEIVLDLINNKKGNINILLYGETGTGKTEFTKTIADTVKKDLYIINNKENESTSDLKRAIIATANMADPKSSIILVDEADSLLNTGFSYFYFGEKNNKSWINTFLDENMHKIIWITNNSNSIEPSVMRRFAFSMKFKRFNTAKKFKVFKYALQQHGLENYFTEEELKTMCGKYSISAGGIADAVKNLRIRNNANKKTVLKRLNIVLKNHETAVTGKEAKMNKMKEMGEYSLKALNTSENIESIITVLRNFSARKSNPKIKALSNINLLFFGQPGTGKTEFAKYLAKSLDQEIVLKRASDLLSCWVGGTEKLIAEAFEEAEQNEAILFLDEADSFFTPRNEAIRSWEKTQTNELLTQMENFKGVLVCATNIKTGLDEASIRRFKFKVEFKTLTPEGNLEIYKCVLAPYVKMGLIESEIIRIKSLKNLTPGEFHIVEDKITLLGGHVSHDRLLQSLKEELKHKPNKNTAIGFAS